ncbi:hypothetical protein HFP68_03105 [Bacillus sp. CB28A.1]
MAEQQLGGRANAKRIRIKYSEYVNQFLLYMYKNKNPYSKWILTQRLLIIFFHNLWVFNL